MHVFDVVEGQRGVVLGERLACPVADRLDQFVDALGDAFGGDGDDSGGSFESISQTAGQAVLLVYASRPARRRPRRSAFSAAQR